MPSVQEMFDHYEGLTNKQKLIFDYIMANPEDICYVSLKDLSQRIGVSEVSVLRTCRAVGFESYVELKEAFRRHTQQLVRKVGDADLTLEGHSGTVGEDDRLHTLRQILANEQHNLQESLSGFDLEQLFACARVLLQAERVVIFGHDASKILADYLAHRLNYLRIHASAVKLDDNTAVQNALAWLDRQDIVVFFSFPPYHIPIFNIARYAEFKGAKLVTITDSLRSPAVSDQGFNILCQTATKFFFNSLTTPISLIGVLTACIAIEMGDHLEQILQEERSIIRFINGEEQVGFESGITYPAKKREE